MANLYNAHGYISPTEYEAFTRLEREQKIARKAARRAAAFRPIVYICSPYSGDTARNVANAQKYSRFAVDCHCVPITPHIYFTQFMNDDDPEERRLALFMNIILMTMCTELWVFGSEITEGMRAELRQAKRKNMRIRYFSEELEEIR